MERDRIHERYRHLTWKWVGPLYYDYPDGEDLPGKLSFCGQVGFLLSAPMGLLNAYLTEPYPTTQIGRFARISLAVIPGVGTGLAFAAATYYATKYRQKDDPLNHAIGGLAAGTIIGAFNGARSGAYMSIFFAAFASVLKHNKDILDKRIYSVHRNWSPYIMRKKDLRGYPDKGDNWVKAPRPEN